MILDKVEYQNKVDTILGDFEKYEKLGKNPVPQVEAKTKQVLKSIAKDKLPKTVIDDLTPRHSRTPVLYGLPKDHKPTVPLRPVVSGSGGPTEKQPVCLRLSLSNY